MEGKSRRPRLLMRLVPPPPTGTPPVPPLLCPTWVSPGPDVFSFSPLCFVSSLTRSDPHLPFAWATSTTPMGTPRGDARGTSVSEELTVPYRVGVRALPLTLLVETAQGYGMAALGSVAVELHTVFRKNLVSGRHLIRLHSPILTAPERFGFSLQDGAFAGCNL